MEYITNNGIRFTQKDNTFSIQNFIADRDEATVICISNDILLNFTDGHYSGMTIIPF